MDKRIIGEIKDGYIKGLYDSADVGFKVLAAFAKSKSYAECLKIESWIIWAANNGI